MTMWKVPPQHSKIYLAIIGAVYVFLIAAIIVLAAYANDWIFWIISTLVEIVIIYIGVKSFIEITKSKTVTPPLGETLTFRKTQVEDNISEQVPESIQNGKEEEK